MDPTLPLDQRGHTQPNNRSRHHHHHSNSSSYGTSRANDDGRKQETRPARNVPGYSPLPSTTTMPLSLQQLGSAASSTESLNSPVTMSGSFPSRSQLPNHHHSASQASVRTEPSYPTHVTRHYGQPENTTASRRPAASPMHDSTSKSVSANTLSSNAYSYRRSNQEDPSPSIYSGRSTSSANSLPPASESSLSAATVMHAYADPKGKGRSTLSAAGPVAVSSRKRVPTEIEEAVRNLGLAPPGTPSHQDNRSTSPYLSVPSTHHASRSTHSLSRSPSADPSVASDAASLSGATASSIASTSQDAHSISASSKKSTAKSTTSKTKKKKPKTTTTTTTTSVIASSASPRPTTSTALLAGATIEVKPKKKKKTPLPTSSGKPPTSTHCAPASPAPTSPGPSSPQSVSRTAAAAPKPARPSKPVATSPQHVASTFQTSHSTTTVPVQRPVPQAAPSRNRHLDESALLRRFPNATTTSASPVQATSDPATRNPLQQQASQVQASCSHTVTTLATSTSAPSAPAINQSSALAANEPPPPPWSAPATTITLAFTPIHAYLSAYHDPVDQPSTNTAQASTYPPIPDSPPPAFRSRSPSPTVAHISSQRRASRSSSLTDEDLPDVDLDALEERSRGYASSENELDLLNSQGRHSGTTTPPLDAAHGESTKGLRWQLRHWEAWRREGISMEERMRRLQEWNSGAQVPDDAGQSLLSAARERSPTISPEVRVPASAHRVSPPRSYATDKQSNAVRTPGLAPSPGPADRQPSPVRSDVSQLAGSGTSQPRFPSVGTIRRVRLQRFEAERQSTRSMADVVQSSPTASTVAAPRPRISAVTTPPPIPGTSTELPPQDEVDSREQVRLAVLQAALDRGSRDTDTNDIEASDTPVENSANTLAATTIPLVEPEVHSRPVPPSAPVADATLEQQMQQPQSSHQLARHLAAELEGRKLSASTGRSSQEASRLTIPAESILQSTSQSTQTTPAAAASPISKVTKESSSPKQLHKAASRISRLFRPNMGPRQQSPRKESSLQGQSAQPLQQVPEVQPAPPTTASSTEPVMTLPKAPPRLTTDPLSTDNLRKLSRHQLRSPSIHAAGSASSSSSEDDVSTSSTSEGDKSGSESDSADDESTKKPPSTVSHIGGRIPSSIAPSTIYAPEAEREAAAASWRRTEDGRRHSALLSRPLSIKRKPPPVPPKRWGGVWDRDVIQERLRRSFNLLDDEEQDGSRPEVRSSSQNGWSRHNPQGTMPGALPTVTEDDQSWEVVGQEPPVNVSQPSATWRTIGRDEDHARVSVLPRFVAPAPDDPRSCNSTNHAGQDYYEYSEADFSTTRRPLPPPPPPPSSTLSSVRSDHDLRPLADVVDRPQDSTGHLNQPALSPRVSLQRTYAVRRPQSMLAQRQRASSSGRASPETARSPPPSPEIRRTLSQRSRHVYSSSVPNVAPLATSQPSLPPTIRRPLPPVPMELENPNSTAPPQSQRFETHKSEASMTPPAQVSPLPPSSSAPQLQEYTDLEVMLASMDEQAPGAVLREVLGVTQPATPEEIDSLPVGRVELERRRVDKKGKIKQKLSCVGINCNKCKICLQQFKEDELAVVLPVCLEVFHAEPCMRAYLATNNRCPSCQAPLM